MSTLVFLDTNIVFLLRRAYTSDKHNESYLLQLYRDNILSFVISTFIITETKRNSLKKLGMRDKAQFQYFLRIFGVQVVATDYDSKDYYLPFVYDEDDALVLSGCVSARSCYLLTRNIKDFRREHILARLGITVTKQIIDIL